MNYLLNQHAFALALGQPTASEEQFPSAHTDLINRSQRWYAKGYTPMVLPAGFFDRVRQQTAAYVQQAVLQALGIALPDLRAYHRYVTTTEQHLLVLHQIGKLIAPERLGIDLVQLEKAVKKHCGIADALTCRGWSDIRVFRPYAVGAMDNNPLHRDTWVPVINNCVNVYIPIVGNNRLSSLSVISGSHLWGGSSLDRTVSNAKINGTQYGLPAVAKIHRSYRVVRPRLSPREALLFSSHLVHGGAVNLNKDTSRVSVEIRFWKK